METDKCKTCRYNEYACDAYWLYVQCLATWTEEQDFEYTLYEAKEGE